MNQNLYTIAIDTTTGKIVAFVDSVQDAHSIELFASAIRRLCRNDFIVVDTCAASFIDSRVFDNTLSLKVAEGIGMFTYANDQNLELLTNFIADKCRTKEIKFIELENTKMTTQTTKPAAATKATTKAAPKTSNGLPTRPKEGTKTGKVWSIADSNYRKTRAEVIELCVKDGINKATASTQYGNWARARKADGKQVGPAVAPKKAETKQATSKAK